MSFGPFVPLGVHVKNDSVVVRVPIGVAKPDGRVSAGFLNPTILCKCLRKLLNRLVLELVPDRRGIRAHSARAKGTSTTSSRNVRRAGAAGAFLRTGFCS